MDQATLSPARPFPLPLAVEMHYFKLITLLPMRREYDYPCFQPCRG